MAETGNKKLAPRLRLIVEAPTQELLDRAIEVATSYRKGYDGAGERPRPRHRDAMVYVSGRRVAEGDVPDYRVDVWGYRDGTISVRAYERADLLAMKDDSDG